MSLPIVGANIIATPIIFVFAWVYVRFGLGGGGKCLGSDHRPSTILNKNKPRGLKRTNEELLELDGKIHRSRGVSVYLRTLAACTTLFDDCCSGRGRQQRKTPRQLEERRYFMNVGKISTRKYGPILRKPGSGWSAE